MEYLKIIILAIIQGLTEFLPVSSSGHLALAEYLLGIESPGVTLEVFLHFGTFLSVLVIFWKDIVKILIAVFGNFWKVWKYPTVMKANEDFAMGVYIALSMIPAGIVGLLFEEQIDGMFDNIVLVGVALLVTGTVLFLTQWAQNERRPLKGWKAFLMGVVQAIAIIPGISRSGSTVSVGMFLGMPREKVAKFSFLMALPLIFGATIMKAKDAFAAEGFVWSGIIIGTVTAFLFGYFAVKWLLRAIIKGRLYIFGFYCLALGFLAIIFG
ncbi:MAG: undecaprenyl-diphosphatase UppP [Candidatus Marinimicrobia bacterium]|nr:undecaprenyl-diphosphatase UppP [Candidatus Neomarinimicrobiota bacterium]